MPRVPLLTEEIDPTFETLNLTPPCASLLAGFTVSFRLRGPVALTVVLLACWAGAAATLLMLPVVWRPDKFAVPLSPITPAMGMFATVFLIGDRAPSPWYRAALCLLGFVKCLFIAMGAAGSATPIVHCAACRRCALCLCRQPGLAGICALRRLAGR